ncbi:hypothetical protein NTH_01187 [Nitratireductor thuwali]|uniref:Cytochrome C oxidase assembly protein n=2 Tax=Nitratireductor thuwali TaxID=2267699 RepID=A0ABY5MFD2_9HYPH|nr:hypothetical protein NTH_01187 [Nitratireductor thuwali]
MVDLSGHLAKHMAAHILAMNLFAPVLAYLWHRTRREAPPLPFGVAAATGLQLAVLWAWHVPAAFASASTQPLIGAAMHLSLFLTALLFWRAVLHAASVSPWRSIAALLVTGKLFCLLGVLLVFSPRPLYEPMGHPSSTSVGSLLADQQAAGLLMLIFCPLTYVLGGILIVRRWIIVDEQNASRLFERLRP